jgi:hypothetical protein
MAVGEDEPVGREQKPGSAPGVLARPGASFPAAFPAFFSLAFALYLDADDRRGYDLDRVRHRARVGIEQVVVRVNRASEHESLKGKTQDRGSGIAANVIIPRNLWAN